MHVAQRNTSTAEAVLDVVLDGVDQHFADPDPLPAGEVTFRVSTPDEPGHKWGLLRLPPNTDKEWFFQQLADSLSWDPSVNSKPREVVASLAEFAGGLTIYPRYGVAELKVCLEAGQYYLLDYNLAGQPGFAHRVRSIRVAGSPPHERLWCLPDIQFEAAPEGGREVFTIADTLPSNGLLLMRNHTDHAQEAVFGRVRPGTTKQDVRDFVLAFRNGRTPVSGAFEGVPAGLTPISPGREAAFRFNFACGEYAVCSYTANPRSGNSGVLDHMLELVTVASR